jgi:aryl-alcohol dehydrogenase-like predicted oxidoreductase
LRGIVSGVETRRIGSLQVSVAGSIVSVIAGATAPEQVRANVEAGDWRLEPSDLAELARSDHG